MFYTERRCTACGTATIDEALCFYCGELARIRLASNNPPRYPINGIPSTKVRELFRVVGQQISEGYSTFTRMVEVNAAPERAQLVSSRIGPTTHAPVLDIDFPAALVPSSTPDHYHLYLDMELSWSRYRRLLRELARAGVIEKGYAKLSYQRGYSTVRVPWEYKQKHNPNDY